MILLKFAQKKKNIAPSLNQFINEQVYRLLSNAKNNISRKKKSVPTLSTVIQAALTLAAELERALPKREEAIYL